MNDTKPRCPWANTDKLYYREYHDTEWGVPVHDDQRHFEMLCLEGAQAGLSWDTVLKKREGYRKAFKGFDPKCVAKMTDRELEQQLQNPTIIRNRLKIYSVRKNAQAFLNIQKEFGSFNTYIWNFMEGKTLVNRWKTLKEIPASTPQSDEISKDLKKHGFSFVGTTIIYAHMQATGLVNDHVMDCWRYNMCDTKRKSGSE